MCSNESENCLNDIEQRRSEKRSGKTNKEIGKFQVFEENVSHATTTTMFMHAERAKAKTGIFLSFRIFGCDVC